MNAPFDPQDWLDLLAYLIIGLPATIAATAAWHKARAAHYEVTNDHGSNIRHDIDELTKSVREGFVDLRKDLGGLREELRTERIERIEGDRLRVVGRR